MRHTGGKRGEKTSVVVVVKNSRVGYFKSEHIRFNQKDKTAVRNEQREKKRNNQKN